MNRDSHQDEKGFHISGIDEFLARSIAKEQTGPLILSVNKIGEQGLIKGTVRGTDRVFADAGVDFQLSPDENSYTDEIDVEDLLHKTLYTGSAYELFDFMFMYFDSLECLIDFSENAWRIEILRAERS